MELVTFNAAHYAQLIEWIASDELNYLWGGPTYTFPLTEQQIEQHCMQNQVHPYLFMANDQKAGFIELYGVEPGHYRLCRVLIADTFRGQGLAKRMLALAIDTAKHELGAKRLSLAVFEHNWVARKSYQALGFDIVSREIGSRTFHGQVWHLLRMEKRL